MDLSASSTSGEGSRRLETKHPMIAIMDYCKRRGVRSLRDQIGLYHARVDDCWEFWLNAHADELKTSEGVGVPPYCVYVAFNGWPASMFSPAQEEVFFVAGDAANLDTFCAALREAGGVT